MAKQGKRYIEARKKIDRDKRYGLAEAIDLVKESAGAKFDETTEVAIRLGVDPRKADQMVRGTVMLPHGTGKSVRVLVFAKGEKELEARDAGADFVGADDLVEKIQGGWLDFDKAVATPDMMGLVGRVAKVLGPRGMMPNPKVGTVTLNVKETVGELKKGKVEFRTDKGANLHVPVGKVSFDPEKLRENIMSLVDTVNRMKPPASKGQYMRNMVISSTMGPGVKIDIASLKE
jgi:large subunit ribosomal protein L1